MKSRTKYLVGVLVAAVGLAVILVATGFGSTEQKVKAVWIYPPLGNGNGFFINATVLEKGNNSIKFKPLNQTPTGGTVIEHSGNYTIEK